MKREDIIQTIRRRQGDAQLSDSEMARRLGISRAHWQKVAAGERRATERVLQGVMAAFPDLTPDVLDIFLARS